ncbi:SDR family NAD(P)-dependent oxidoreductase [Falsiroseomonas sp. HW251]|uniref:SDR family NAD(P)-dependent oxidoreductase n=1 Tax=Falsiroseomonas sp. HW251 TaxID=3390998 RepID=UPI003D320642
MDTDTAKPDRVAIVTGGGRGIGAAVAQALARQGARVAVLDPIEPEISVDLHVPTDVADQASVEGAVARVVRDLGGVDVLVNNAGIMPSSTLRGMKPGEWERVIAVNLSGAFYAIRAAAEPMRRRGGGAIVNIASINAKGRISTRGGAHYTASKAALLGLTRHTAFEFARDRIRVNAVCPGPTLTGMGSTGRDAPPPSYIPLGEWVLPQDIAEAVLFLCSPAARMITGTTLDVDGGSLLSYSRSMDDYFALRDRG